jgi:hypothetical protein
MRKAYVKRRARRYTMREVVWFIGAFVGARLKGVGSALLKLVPGR